MKYEKLNYQYRTVSIEHLTELQSYIQALDQKGSISMVDKSFNPFEMAQAQFDKVAAKR